MMPIISCSWATEPRDISPGCPCTLARTSGIPMELCGTQRRTRTMQVSGAGTAHPCSGLLVLQSQQQGKNCFGCLSLSIFLVVFTSHSLLSNISGQVEEGQDCRLQWRDTRSDSQESLSPDSACYVSCDSRGSSPDCNLNGELRTPYTKVTIQHILGIVLFYLHNCNDNALPKENIYRKIRKGLWADDIYILI